MKRAAWNRFVSAREHYRSEIAALRRSLPGLRAIQQQLVNSRGTPYPVETPIVFNSALDDVTVNSDIRLILVGDNPGRREQAAENRRYLVGPSGKIAEKFFRDNPGLDIDFRTQAIILNKTPIHTPRTAELKELCTRGTPALRGIIDNSQRIMARLLREFHQALSTGSGAPMPVWIIGYSEMKKGGIFAAYTDELKTLYRGTKLSNEVFLYRHFSMNQFTIDLNRQKSSGEALAGTLQRLGTAYREQYLW